MNALTHMGDPSPGEKEHHQQHEGQWPRMVGMRESRQGRDEASPRRQRLLPVRPGDNDARDRDGDNGLHLAVGVDCGSKR